MHHTRTHVLLGLLSGVLALSLAACGGGGAASAPTASGDAANGKTLFLGTCSACHGPEAIGVVGLGKDLTTSTFLAGLTEEQFLDFVKTGRPTSDPANTTGVDMPPRGGNPALTDDNVIDILAFLRSIQK